MSASLIMIHASLTFIQTPRLYPIYSIFPHLGHEFKRAVKAHGPPRPPFSPDWPSPWAGKSPWQEVCVCYLLAGLVGLILAESGPIILTVPVSLIYTMRLDWAWTGLASPVQSSADHGEPEKDMQSLSFMEGVSVTCITRVVGC